MREWLYAHDTPNWFFLAAAAWCAFVTLASIGADRIDECLKRRGREPGQDEDIPF